MVCEGRGKGVYNSGYKGIWLSLGGAGCPIFGRKSLRYRGKEYWRPRLIDYTDRWRELERQ